MRRDGEGRLGRDLWLAPVEPRAHVGEEVGDRGAALDVEHIVRCVPQPGQIRICVEEEEAGVVDAEMPLLRDPHLPRRGPILRRGRDAPVVDPLAVPLLQ